MKKYGAIAAALFAALLGIAALAPSAQAAVATYPAPTVTLTVSATTVTSGSTFTATVTSSVTCHDFFSFAGQHKTGVGKVVTRSFRAPNVTSTQVFPLTVTCTYSTTSGGVGHAIMASTASTSRTVNITVVPAGAAASLPNTGGPSMWWFVGGALAILIGAGAMFTTRRRSAVA